MIPGQPEARRFEQNIRIRDARRECRSIPKLVAVGSEVDLTDSFGSHTTTEYLEEIHLVRQESPASQRPHVHSSQPILIRCFSIAHPVIEHPSVLSLYPFDLGNVHLVKGVPYNGTVLQDGTNKRVVEEGVGFRGSKLGTGTENEAQ